MKGTLRFSPNIGVKGDAGKAGDAGFRSLKGPEDHRFGYTTCTRDMETYVFEACLGRQQVLPRLALRRWKGET